MADRRWLDSIIIAAGIRLLISPWGLGGPAVSSATWNAWILGTAIAIVAIWALFAPRSATPEFVNAIFGAWTFIAPWVVGFSGTPDAWNAWIVGAIVCALAVCGIRGMGAHGGGISARA